MGVLIAYQVYRSVGTCLNRAFTIRNLYICCLKCRERSTDTLKWYKDVAWLVQELQEVLRSNME